MSESKKEPSYHVVSGGHRMYVRHYLLKVCRDKSTSTEIKWADKPQKALKFDKQCAEALATILTASGREHTVEGIY